MHSPQHNCVDLAIHYYYSQIFVTIYPMCDGLVQQNIEAINYYIQKLNLTERLKIIINITASSVILKNSLDDFLEVTIDKYQFLKPVVLRFISFVPVHHLYNILFCCKIRYIFLSFNGLHVVFQVTILILSC
jgi:hypothetical protein